MTTASICTIGDEILIGQIVDTNSSYISRALNSLGIRVTSMLSIADDHDAIISKLENELRDNDIVIVTGGLGPTKDMSPFKILISCGSSSTLVARIILPTGVILSSFSAARRAVPFSASGIILLNLYILNSLPPFVMRICL